MLILGIDTSTSAITVGLARAEGEGRSLARLDSRGHSEQLAPLVVELLREEGALPADLTAIAVGTGPGPFTGLRVGIVTGLTMGYALDIPVHGVCSLDVLAAQADSSGLSDFVVATDARRKEVYWARYAAHAPRPRRCTEPAVERPGELPESVRELPTVGRGPVLYPDLFHDPRGPLDVDAGVLAVLCRERLGAGVAMPVEPLYLRRPDALTTAERGSR